MNFFPNCFTSLFRTELTLKISLISCFFPHLHTFQICTCGFLFLPVLCIAAYQRIGHVDWGTFYRQVVQCRANLYDSHRRLPLQLAATRWVSGAVIKTILEKPSKYLYSSLISKKFNGRILRKRFFWGPLLKDGGKYEAKWNRQAKS